MNKTNNLKTDISNKLPVACLLLALFVYACDGKGNAKKDNNRNTVHAALKVSTFNVIDFDFYGYSQDEHKAIADIIEDNEIDVIALQEVPKGDTLVINELANRGINMNYVCSTNNSDNVALYSRYAITSSSAILTGTCKDPVSGISYSMSNQRPVMEVGINTGENNWWLYVCHLKASEGGTNLAKRRAQAYALANYLTNRFSDMGSERIIILGDMNTVDAPDTNAYDDWDREGTMGYLTLQHDNDPSNDFIAVNYTYMPDQPTYPEYGSIIDHIIASPKLMEEYIPESAGVITYPRPSDHYVVYTEFYLE